MTPYLFGTLGVVNDSVVHRDLNGAISVGDSDRQIGLQMGAGLQFNNILGAEVFYQAGKSHEYTALNGADLSAKAKVLGARVTAGSNVTEKLRLFGKLGVASVKHSSGQFADLPNHSSSQTRPTVGVGFTYALSESLMLRGDADHYPLRGSENPRWGNVDYFGLGLQYNF
jgi:opacity protein-like surface antigen